MGIALDNSSSNRFRGFNGLFCLALMITLKLNQAEKLKYFIVSNLRSRTKTCDPASAVGLKCPRRRLEIHTTHVHTNRDRNLSARLRGMSHTHTSRVHSISKWSQCNVFGPQSTQKWSSTLNCMGGIPWQWFVVYLWIIARNAESVF